jgi:hypothetical protein
MYMCIAMCMWIGACASCVRACVNAYLCEPKVSLKVDLLIIAKVFLLLFFVWSEMIVDGPKEEGGREDRCKEEFGALFC